MQLFKRSILAAAVLATTLAGCSSGQLGDAVPSAAGGLPADAPARAATPGQFPAVYDSPPPRGTTPMTAEDQLSLEKDLESARDKQNALASQPDPGEAPPAPAKKPPAATGGAKTSGTKPNP